MISFIKKYKNSFLFGLLAGLAFPPFYLFIFLPFSFYFLIKKIVADVSNKKEAFLFGTIFGFGYFLVQLYWISFSLLVDIKTYFWLLPFAISLIPLACSFYLGLTTLSLFYIIKKFNIKNSFIITLIFSCFYIIFEYLKGLIFPWNLFSYILGFSDILIQIVSIINIYFLNFIIILFFCFGFVLFEYKNKKIIFLKNQKMYIIFYLLTLFFIVIFGFIRLSISTPKEFNTKFRLVQANIPQTLKWDRSEVDRNLEKYKQLTTKINFDDIDIIIWSESSIPFVLTENTILPQEFSYLRDKILITGAVRGNIENNQLTKVWNSIFIFKNNQIIDYYDKSLLVPFGEYIPFSKFLPFLKKITNGGLDFSTGYGNKTIKINGITISPIICYEVIFPNKIIDKKNRPDIIINLTNDGWFGRSSGPYQHLVAAKFRAVENKIPIIRVSGSGISTYINEYGIVTKKIELNKTGILDIKI